MVEFHLVLGKSSAGSRVYFCCFLFSRWCFPAVVCSTWVLKGGGTQLYDEMKHSMYSSSKQVTSP